MNVSIEYATGEVIAGDLLDLAVGAGLAPDLPAGEEALVEALLAGDPQIVVVITEDGDEFYSSPSGEGFGEDACHS